MVKCVLAASEAVDQTLDNITWVAEDAIPGMGAASDNLPLPKRLPYLAGIYFGGASMERGRIVTTHLTTRGPWLPDFRPVDTATDPGDEPPYHDLRSTPLLLIDPSATVQDNVNVQVENDGAGAAVDASALAVFSDGPIQPVSLTGYWPVRFTGTLTPAAAEVWSAAFSPTLAQTIPQGVYSCAGVEMQGATAKFWQARGLDPELNRMNEGYPVGGLCVNADTERLPVGMRPGDLGVLFHFRSDQLPQFRLLCDTNAAQSPSGRLWLRKVA